MLVGETDFTPEEIESLTNPNFDDGQSVKHHLFNDFEPLDASFNEYAKENGKVSEKLQRKSRV